VGALSSNTAARRSAANADSLRLAANTDMFIHLTNNNHKLAERSAAPIRTAAFGGSAAFSCQNMSQSLIIIVVYVGQVLWKHWLNMERNFFPPRVILPRVIRTDNNKR